MVEVPNTKKEALWPLICRYIKTGSKIMSDVLASYTGLENITDKSFEHGVVFHKYNFVDPDSGDHTQSIESNWQKFKQNYIKSKFGIPDSLFTSYVNEHIWKKEFKENRMYELWKLNAQLFQCT
uniref:ISXO2-like transposase domain-containing protein n=1 Tax=Ditylenchus dipsaci TaxID=166011 RepID=A0A915D917_9BILA